MVKNGKQKQRGSNMGFNSIRNFFHRFYLHILFSARRDDRLKPSINKLGSTALTLEKGSKRG